MHYISYPNMIVWKMSFLFASLLLACLLFIAFKFLNKVWFNPIYVNYFMKSQGIKGPSYKFLHGNTKEISMMRRASASKAMEGSSHNIFPRILPDVYQWRNLYGSIKYTPSVPREESCFCACFSNRNTTLYVGQRVNGATYLNWHGTQAQLVVTEPELVKEILNNRNGDYPKMDLQGYAKLLLGDGLSSSKGEKWAKMRKLANQVFHAESLKNMIPEMIASTEIMLSRWKEHEGQELEVFEEFRMLTSEVISRTAFGSSYMEGKSIFDMLMKLTLIVSRNAYKIRYPGISWILKSEDEIEAERLEQGIKSCIRNIIKKKYQNETSKGSFLEKLLENKITLEDIVDECKTFYFAGHETTTSLLAWTIFLIAKHQEWQEKARKEVIEIFGQDNISPNADDIPKLKIVNMILEEALRLYPPVPSIMRKVDKKVKLGGLTLPAKTFLLISPLALHHDPKIWGEHVLLFNPSRFAGGVNKATNNNPVAFLPFGFGPRTCVGLNFAIVEAKVALSMILQRYKFIISPNHKHSPVQIFMVRPQHGVRIILSKICVVTPN